MFERFTDDARQVVVLSQDEARALGNNWIGTEHLLLGLLRQEDGIAAKVLLALGITLGEARASVVRLVGQTNDAAVAGQIPFTPRAKRVLELGLREALALGDNFIASEHILLGLIREDEGLAATILVELGSDAETIRNETIRNLSGRARAKRRRAGRPPTGPTPAPAPASWEYRVDRPDSPGELTADWLNAVGADGWELVGFAPDARLIFKRRVVTSTQTTAPDA